MVHAVLLTTCCQRSAQLPKFLAAAIRASNLVSVNFSQVPPLLKPHNHKDFCTAEAEYEEM